MYTLKKDSGVTLLEMMAVFVIISILAVIGLPSLFSMMQSSKVREDHDRILSLLRSSQRNAIRMSKGCTLTFNLSSDVLSSVSKSDLGCFSDSFDNFSSNIKIDNPVISFSFRGHTINDSFILLYSPDSEIKKCIAISNHLGLIRSGSYQANVNQTLDKSQCKTNI